MSLYNMVCGNSPVTKILLDWIGMCPADFPRYRDVSLEPEGNCVEVLTRSGGPNNECFCEGTECDDDCMEAHNNLLKETANFISFRSDEFDCTYGIFSFSPVEEYKEDFNSVMEKLRADNYKNDTLEDKFNVAMGNLKKATPTEGK